MTSVLLLLTIMITLMPTKGIVWERMFLSLTLLMNICITCCVLLRIGERLSSFNSCVRIIILRGNILFGNSLESKDRLTLLMLPLDNLEACSKSCVGKLSMFPYSCLILYWKSHKYPSRKIKRHLWGLLSLRTCARWKSFSQIRQF